MNEIGMIPDASTVAGPSPWSLLTPAEKQAFVRQAVQVEGLTYAAAADRLGTTRLAIAGIVERSKRLPEGRIMASSGLTTGAGNGGRRTAASKKANRARKPPKVKHQGFHRFVSLPMLAEPMERVPARTDVWDALPGTAPLPLERLREHQCRWPCGDPALFCAEPVQPDSVYCPAHHVLAYREPPPLKARKGAHA